MCPLLADLIAAPPTAPQSAASGKTEERETTDSPKPEAPVVERFGAAAPADVKCAQEGLANSKSRLSGQTVKPDQECVFQAEDDGTPFAVARISTRLRDGGPIARGILSVTTTGQRSATSPLSGLRFRVDGLGRAFLS
jgi:hypothetical protein